MVDTLVSSLSTIETFARKSIKGGKVCNYKTVTSNSGQNRITVKVNKTFALKAKPVPVSGKQKAKKHRGIAYESSNTSVASVSSKGVVKGIKKGTAYIYAYAQNGICKKIKVIVK